MRKITIKRAPGLPMAPPVEYKIVSDKRVYLTKNRAEEVLNLEVFPGERDVRENHVQMLYNEAIAGRFMWHHVIIGIAKCGEHTYRVNGQHTCWMRYLLPDEYDGYNCSVREIVYEVETLDQVRDLYSTFDRNAPRTTGHIARVLLMDSQATSGVAMGLINRVTAGFRLWKFETDWAIANNPAEVITMIETQFAALFNTVAKFMYRFSNEINWIRRSSVLAAMFATFEKAPQKAVEFWEPVCSGLGLNESTDPRYHLRKYLDATSHTTSTKGKTAVSQEEAYRVCVQAWNRWRSGEKVSTLRSTEKRVNPK